MDTEKNFKATLKKIKLRGHWIINIQPNDVIEERIISVTKCEDIVKQSSIHLRGWDYPHFPTHNIENQAIYAANDRTEAWIDWEMYKEIWRFYKNGHFIHYAALREDWTEEGTWKITNDPWSNIKPGKILAIVNNIYTITEIFLFAKNLMETDLYEAGISIELTLVNTDGRVLQTMDPMRAPLLMEYKTMINDITLPKKLYPNKEAFLKQFMRDSLNLCVELCYQFNWKNPPIEVIKEDQKKLIERRI